MTSVADHYQTLGVMPEAEQIVITAAYRALASRYHPDRWKGDKDEATRMMSKINVAYGVLGDAEKRKAYDASRGPARSAFSEQTDETEDAFEEAIHDYDERWETACSVYPDLKTLRGNLAKTSRALAFSFVVAILETKQFDARDRLARLMENSFLERHFGSNPKIIAYARSLIRAGERDAIKHLNKLIDVLGDGADADKIIQAVNNAFKPEERQRSEPELTEEEVDYLGLPIKAIHYLEKYKKTEDQLAHACAMKKIKWVVHDGVLWVSDEPYGWQGEGGILIAVIIIGATLWFVIS